MEANILNNKTQLYYVSYEMGLRLQVVPGANETFPFRLKVGAQLFLDGDVNSFGTVEVDVTQFNEVYVIDIGEVVKQYIQPEMLYEETKQLDFRKDLSILPFYRKKSIDGDWETIMNYDNKVTLKVIRGVNKDYYLLGDVTPKETGDSYCFSYNQQVTKYRLPLGSYKFIYKQLYTEINSNPVSYLVTYTDYGIYNGKPVHHEQVLDAFVGKDDNVLAIKLAPVHTELGFEPKYTTIKIEEKLGSPVSWTNTYNIRVDYICTNNEFVFDLVYLGHNFRWESLNFKAKNKVNFSRQTQMVEDYNRNRFDINLTTRQIVEATSDLLTLAELKDSELMGLGQHFKITTPNRDGNIFRDVRLLDKSVDMKFGKDEPMAQITVRLEISEQAKTA